MGAARWLQGGCEGCEGVMRAARGLRGGCEGGYEGAVSANRNILCPPQYVDTIV